MTDSTQLVATEQPQQVALTVQDRAVIALGGVEREEALKALAKKYADITEVKNKAARQQVHAAAMELANERIATKKTGETAREDANALQKAVIERQKFLIGIIEPPEKRLLGLRDKWDEAEEAERQAKLEAEQKRVGDIRSRIADMAAIPTMMVGKSSETIAIAIESLEATEITLDTHQEFAGEGEMAKIATIDKLREMWVAQAAVELAAAEAARQAELDRIERERVAEENRLEAKRLADLAAAMEVEAQLARDRQALADKQAREKREAAEAEQRAANERAAAAMRAEQAQHEARMREQQAAADKMNAAMSEIQGIQQQVIIATQGRLGVRKGGTIDCIRETLAETEAWELDPERFGILAGAAESAKTTAVAEIRRLLGEAEAKEREDAEARRQREEAEAAAEAEARRVAEAEAAEAARLQAEKEAAEREQARRVRVQFEKNGPGDEAIVARLADIFDVRPLVVVGWLEKFNAAAFKAPEEKAA
ncbi:hypothetical protein [Paraburkholderia sp. BCC1885]|uniref:hypothetical protein n=1 Tax=Paraburkholderia sp. BCC1885 TaxID=2562669 RepID=UPI001184525E|nr:hypothetical protein [Paraburkholderia sp. BCC1885]